MMFHGEQKKRPCIAQAPLLLYTQPRMPEMKISRPMPMRMTPPRTEALPESLVPNFLPMERPAAQIKKVVTFFICMAGLRIGKKFGTKLSGKASILGGIILIGIGLEIFISGVF